MERLRAGDVAALLATLPDLYAFQTLDAFSTTLTSAIPRLIGSEVTSYTEVEPGRGRTRVATRPQGAVSPAQHERFAQLSHQHPLVRHYRENRDSRALKITDVMPQSNFRKLPIYEEFFRPVGVDRQLAITLASTASVVVGLALNRRGSDFTERDRLILDLLRPHAVQAYENATTASAVLAELKATRRIIEEADAGIVILGHEGEVRSMSAGARALLNQCFDGGGHWASGAALPDDLDRWVVSRLAALRDAEQPPE